MAGHRSPRGNRARRNSSAIPARHLIAGSPAPSGPSLRTTLVASAAAIGAVATGTLATLVPTPGDGTTGTASADEAPLRGSISTTTAALLSNPAITAIGAFSPVDEGSGEGFANAQQHLAMLGKAADIAQQIADDAAKAQSAAADKARLESLVEAGGVNGWIAQALNVLGLPQGYAPGVRRIVMAESGGNPYAINLSDSNARRGTPSQGLMQTIPSTYRHYVAPELSGRPITDPVANITAGVNYMITNYGVGTLVSGGNHNSSGGYVGY